MPYVGNNGPLTVILRRVNFPLIFLLIPRYFFVNGSISALNMHKWVQTKG